MDTTVIISALIGAGVGSVGATLLGTWLVHKNESRRDYAAIVQRYLLQLQDSAESLWFRLDNLQNRGGRSIMEEKYYEESTIYALGKLFAMKYILVYEGAQASIERIRPGLGVSLRNKLEDIDAKLNEMNYTHDLKVNFYRYDRQALADALIGEGGDYPRTISYLHFRELYEDTNSSFAKILEPAKEFVLALDKSQVGGILNDLSEIASLVQTETGINTSIKSGRIE